MCLKAGLELHVPCAQRRYEEAEERSAQENQRLTLDFQRTAAAFTNLQAKFARFQGGSISRFQEARRTRFGCYCSRCPACTHAGSLLRETAGCEGAVLQEGPHVIAVCLTVNFSVSGCALCRSGR